MNQMTAGAAIGTIMAATVPVDLFDGRAADKVAARHARRKYRSLVALIHPDLAERRGIDLALAEQATAKLNDFYERWQHRATATERPAAAHVIGSRGTYLLIGRTGADDAIATYETDRAHVRIEIARNPRVNGQIATLETVSDALASPGLPAYAPEVIDSGETSGHSWVAYRIPEGLISLREIATAFPRGLDGRDWAWMARRILIALDAAGVPHGALSTDTVLIHPDHHGVVLTGWRGVGAHDIRDLGQLFQTMLQPGQRQQTQFAAAGAALTPAQFLREYDLLLRRLYGERRYRPFTIPVAA